MTEGIYGASEENTNASKREALAALARGGTAERDAFLASQEAARGDQSRVLQQIMDRATKLGAGGAGAEMAAAAQPGFDRRSQALLGAQGSAEAALGQITASNSNYFDQVNAAVPIVKARTDEIVAAAKAKAEQERLDRELELQIKQMALMAAEAKARGDSGGGGVDELSDSELKNRLMGAAAVQRKTQPMQPPKKIMGLKLPQLSQEASARRIGVEAGLDPSRVFGLVPNKTPAKKPAPAKSSQTTHRTNVTQRVQKHASKNTYETFLNLVAGEPATATDPAIPPVRSMAEALREVKKFPDAELKRLGVSRDALTRWLTDYFSV